MRTNVKLIVGAVLIAGLTGYLGYLGASTSWRYYVVVDECLRDASHLAGRRLRVSGQVAPQSLDIAADRSRAAFELAGASGRLRVECLGPLPDNLAEGMDVVVEGTLEAGCRLNGDKVLTRCASKYEAEAGDGPVARTAERPK